jgi:hypothetical protein
MMNTATIDVVEFESNLANELEATEIKREGRENDEWSLTYKDLIVPAFGGLLGILSGFALCWASAPWVATKKWDKNASVFSASIYSGILVTGWALMMGHLWSIWLAERNDDGYSLKQLHSVTKHSLFDTLSITSKYLIEWLGSKRDSSVVRTMRGSNKHEFVKSSIVAFFSLMVLLLPIIVALMSDGPYWSIGFVNFPLASNTSQVLSAMDEARWTYRKQEKNSFDPPTLMDAYGGVMGERDFSNVDDMSIQEGDVGFHWMLKPSANLKDVTVIAGALGNLAGKAVIGARAGDSFMVNTACVPSNGGKITVETNPGRMLLSEYNVTLAQDQATPEGLKCFVSKLTPIDFEKGRSSYEAKAGLIVENIGAYYKLEMASSWLLDSTCFRTEFLCGIAARKTAERVVNDTKRISPLAPQTSTGELDEDEKQLAIALVRRMIGITSVDRMNSKLFPSNTTSSRMTGWEAMTPAVVDIVGSRARDHVSQNEAAILNIALSRFLRASVISVIQDPYISLVSSNATDITQITQKSIDKWLEQTGRAGLYDIKYDALSYTQRVYGESAFYLGCIVTSISLLFCIYVLYVSIKINSHERMMSNYISDGWKVVQSAGRSSCNLVEGEEASRDRSNYSTPNLRFYDDKKMFFGN